MALDCAGHSLAGRSGVAGPPPGRRARTECQVIGEVQHFYLAMLAPSRPAKMALKGLHHECRLHFSPCCGCHGRLHPGRRAAGEDCGNLPGCCSSLGRCQQYHTLCAAVMVLVGRLRSSLVVSTALPTLGGQVLMHKEALTG